MGFFDDNKNFIIQELNVKMKGFSIDEKRKIYVANAKLRQDTLRRLKLSYDRKTEKDIFYKEAFKHLAIYETNFLLMSLFYEEESNEILKNILNVNSNIHCDNDEYFVPDFIEYIESKKQNSCIFEFVKIEFSQLIGLDDNDWRNQNANQNPINRKFAEWITKNNNDTNKLINGILLFSKIWSLLWNNPFNTTKAIVLIHTLNNNHRLNHKVFDTSKSILDNLLPTILNPFNMPTEGQTPGFIKQRNIFDNKLETSRALSINYETMDFKDVFQELLRHRFSEEISNQILESIRRKIDSGMQPSTEELVFFDFHEYDEFTPIKNLIFRKCYLYDK